jgi:glycosyltransferase involved in cell wall biosynthesis
MRAKIPVTVIVTTKNEERNLPRCLAALEHFSQIIVVDSESTDRTGDIAKSFGAELVTFRWNGAYPKKRQWCLDHLSPAHDFIFFVDADEEVTPALARDIAACDFSCDGYFIEGAYVVKGRALRFGLRNKKLCLFRRAAFRFPVVDDLNFPGMGEIEGHYQPVATGKVRIGAFKNPLLHHAMEDWRRWNTRHQSYARWESAMRAGNVYPADPGAGRRIAKKIFFNLPFRPLAAFLHSYIIRLGFLEGQAGFALARSRMAYYRMVERSAIYNRGA